MNALAALRSGDLKGALAGAKQDARAAPGDSRVRTFLFQLFCVTGEWHRALNQLAVAAELDPLAKPMAEAYRVAIRCEMMREKVFRGERSPTVLGDPVAWLPLLIAAIGHLAAGRTQEAARLRDAAFDEAPASAGDLDDMPCEWIADADPRLGPVLEVFVNGSYFWVPFMRLSALRLEPPVDLRDQVWMPASFTWSNGGEAAGFIPTRYPGSANALDTLIALSRRTEWHEVGDGWSLPIGQRVLVTDTAETALMDIRQLRLGPVGA